MHKLAEIALKEASEQQAVSLYAGVVGEVPDDEGVEAEHTALVKVTGIPLPVALSLLCDDDEGIEEWGAELLEWSVSSPWSPEQCDPLSWFASKPSMEASTGADGLDAEIEWPDFLKIVNPWNNGSVKKLELKAKKWAVPESAWIFSNFDRIKGMAASAKVSFGQALSIAKSLNEPTR